MIRFLLVATILWAAPLTPSTAGETPTTPRWAAVNEALEANLPKTAIEALGPIAQWAGEQNQTDQWILASVMQITLAAKIGQPADADHLVAIQSLIDQAPEAAKPILLAIRADWLLRYYQTNRWEIAQRTATADQAAANPAAKDPDLETWSLPEIIAAVDRAYTDALAYGEVLKNEPLANYQNLVVDAADVSALPTPTWYDFIVRRAIDFYPSPDYDVSVPKPPLTIRSHQPGLGSMESFLDWKIDSGANVGSSDGGGDDGVSITLRLYQSWLRYRLDHESSHPAALVAADLARLQFVSERMVGGNVDVQYDEALRRLAERLSDNDAAAMVLDRLARREPDLARSLRIAQQIVQQYPGSLGAKNAAKWAKWITSSELGMTTESVWIEGENAITLRYRNVEKVFFRLVEFQSSDDPFPRNRHNTQFLRDLLSRETIADFDSELPSTDDFQITTHPVNAPASLDFGRYWLLACDRESFDAPAAEVMRQPIVRSDLAAVTRSRYSSPTIDGIIANNRSGYPIENATIIPQQMVRHDKWVDLPTLKTDVDGRFKIKGGNSRKLRYQVALGKDRLWIDDSVSFGRKQNQAATRQSTILMTDRGVYRPGQTIHFKGLVVAANQDKADYRVVSNLNVDVTAADINNQAIIKIATQTNAMGSFHGSIEIPKSIPTGVVSLRTNLGSGGYTFVSVEQYKRPKFEVQIESPQTAIIGKAIKMNGLAKSYTGFPVSGATVRYRITRQINFPQWCYWAPPNPPIEIDAASTVTDQDGRFEFEFDAVAEDAADNKIPLGQTHHRYQVSVDVIDNTGETRSSRSSVLAGYTDRKIDVSSPRAAMTRAAMTQQPVEFFVNATTLGGDGIVSSGQLRIHRLVPPGKPTSPEPPSPYGHLPGTAASIEQIRDWETGEMIESIDFQSDGDGRFETKIKLPAGAYRAVVVTDDLAGERSEGRCETLVLDPLSRQCPLAIDNVLLASATAFAPGDDAVVVWGSGRDNARAYVEVLKDNNILQAYWTPAGRTQHTIEHKIDQSLRGGITFRTTSIFDGRVVVGEQVVNVPWSNKLLRISAERLRSRITPGEKEKIVLRVIGPDAKGVAAEIAATMYDASLDSIRPFEWPGIDVLRSENSYLSQHFSSQQRIDTGLRSHVPASRTWRIPRFVGGVAAPWPSHRRVLRMVPAMMPNADGFDAETPMEAEASVLGARGEVASYAMANDQSSSTNPANAPVQPRTNLGESAFFLPVLKSQSDGAVTIEFTVPDSLTRWRILAFAHDQELRHGRLDVATITAKDLMVEPNPPRFVRAGDEIQWTTKISNASATRQTGTSRIAFENAFDESDITADLLVDAPEQSFDLASGESIVLEWKLNVPSDIDALIYRVTATSERASDGQEDMLAVLPRRVAVVESMEMPIRGAGQQSFVFKPLAGIIGGDDVDHRLLRLRVTSNAAWHAIFSLPYLMEYPHQCSEQTFARLYANSVASKIAGDNPRFRRVIESWRTSGAIESPLMKNEDLRSIAIAETPWLAEGKSETQARSRLAGLFEQNRLDDEFARAWRDLTEMQRPDGSFPWFPGGPSNDYITLTIATGIGRMRAMGIDVDVAPAIRSWAYLDGVMNRRFKNHHNRIDAMTAMYLYGRSFVGDELAIAPEYQVAFDHWVDQAARHWSSLPILSQSHIALAMHRGQRGDVAAAVVQSVMQHSVLDSEQGLHWPSTANSSGHWYQSPIETQAMIIKMLDEVAGDAASVEEAKVWLIKQKQAQSWPTTKSTTDAVHAILMRGKNPLRDTQPMTAIVGGETLEPSKVELGTGAYSSTWSGKEIRPSLGNVTIRRQSDGVGWASMNLLSMRELGDIRQSEDQSLSIQKQIFVRRSTPNGPRLFPVNDSGNTKIHVGDELVSRLTIQCDRDMEFVHVRDHRGSGTEPVDILSKYTVVDGLWIYHSTRDSATHYFIDRIPKGIYVLENVSRVQLAGRYTTGYAMAQCMYAPEFSSHSGSIEIDAADQHPKPPPQPSIDPSARQTPK